jgi:tetratricopeptide (TPR) repeat protein
MLSRCRQLAGYLRRRPAILLPLLAGLVLLGLGGYPCARYLGAWRHCYLGERALERGDPGQARAQLAACLQVWPKDARVLLLAVRAARRTGALDEAEQHLAACQEAGGVTEETTLEWALLRAQRGEFPQVEGYLRARIEDGRTDPLPILEVLTAELMRTRRLTDAEQYLDRWLERKPDDPVALVRRGWVAEHLFHDSAAAQYYLHALAVTPDNDNVRLRLAEIQERTGYATEAVANFERLRGRQPGEPAVLLGLARCRRRLGQPEEARQLLEALLADHPLYAPALSERGRLALDAGQLAEAEVWLRKAADQDPHDRQIVYNLYRCLEQLGKQDEAHAWQERLGQIEADAKRMNDLMEEVKKRPREAPLLCEVGVVFLRNGFKEDGLSWLIAASEADPAHRPTRQALAEYYEQNGQPELAAQQRRILQQLGGDGDRPGRGTGARDLHRP